MTKQQQPKCKCGHYKFSHIKYNGVIVCTAIQCICEEPQQPEQSTCACKGLPGFTNHGEYACSNGEVTINIAENGKAKWCYFCGDIATNMNYKPSKDYGIAYDLCDKCRDEHKKTWDEMKKPQQSEQTAVEQLRSKLVNPFEPQPKSKERKSPLFENKPQPEVKKCPYGHVEFGSDGMECEYCQPQPEVEQGTRSLEETLETVGKLEKMQEASPESHYTCPKRAGQVCCGCVGHDCKPSGKIAEHFIGWTQEAIAQAGKQVIDKIKRHFETMVFDNTGEDKLANIIEFRKKQSEYLEALKGGK